MAEIIQLVCDKCGSMDGVGAYRLSTPETGLTRAQALDLCETCAAPLGEFEGMGRTVSRSKSPTVRYRPGRGGKRLRAKVLTQEEIDAIEREENE